MWYENIYRRHLSDMHIDDWNPEFLSKFNYLDYFDNLKRAKIQSAMIYTMSHVGLSFYPTKTGKIHGGLKGKENDIKKLIEKCHDEGICVTGYYSLIYNNYAHDTHKDWRIVDKNGVSAREKGLANNLDFATGSIGRYGTCCPNNPDYRNYTEEQIKEISEQMTFDTFFYDMLFWPDVCYCEHCKARWKSEVGTEMPEPENSLFMEKRREWMTEFTAWITEVTKKYMNGIPVTHNFASALQCCGSRCVDIGINDCCEYSSGDLYGSVYEQSLSCKYYKAISKHQPFEYSFSRCDPDLGSHTTLRSHDKMLSMTLLTAAHNGATMVIDAIDPVGTFDKRVYDHIGSVFAEAEKFDKFYGGTMVKDVGIYYSLKSKEYAYNPICNYEGSVLTNESLIKNHVPYGITGVHESFDGYKVIVASSLTDLDGKELDRLIEYVNNGGMLYFSGGKATKLLEEFFGAKCVGDTEETVTYIAPVTDNAAGFGRFNNDYPISYPYSMPMVEGVEKADVIANITLPYTLQNTTAFASIHSNPPGIKTEMPAMVVKNFGKGRVFWSAAALECVKNDISKHLFYSLLREYLPFDASITSDAPENCELIVYKNGGGYRIWAVELVSQDNATGVEPFSININLSISASVETEKFKLCQVIDAEKNKTEVLQTFECN